MSIAQIRNYFSPATLPETPEQLLRSSLYKQWWYYTIELLPGKIAQGVYPDNFPMLHRTLMRQLNLQGATCLDIGTMEGLMPVLMCRGGAEKVVAVDAEDHCREKMDALKHYYDVDFDFHEVGLLYELTKKLQEVGAASFDFINFSGVLYHVYSPLMALAGARALLKRGGYMIVSTNVVLSDEAMMVFNDRGRFQVEPNTFWYISVPALDYMLRYLKLAPVDCRYLPHDVVNSDLNYTAGANESGYLSIICRAENDVMATPDDKWMAESAKFSWEHRGLTDWDFARKQPKSRVTCSSKVDDALRQPGLEALDLRKAIPQKTVCMTDHSQDAHILKLSDRA